MSHVPSSETGIPISRLLKLGDTADGIRVRVLWNGLPHSEDTFPPLGRIFQTCRNFSTVF